MVVEIRKNGETYAVWGEQRVTILPPDPDKAALTVPAPDQHGRWPLVYLAGKVVNDKTHAVTQGGIGWAITLCGRPVDLPLPPTGYGEPQCRNCRLRLAARKLRAERLDAGLPGAGGGFPTLTPRAAREPAPAPVDREIPSDRLRAGLRRL